MHNFFCLFLVAISFIMTIGCLGNAPQLNRQNFLYKAPTPPLPQQSKNYLNIANYNIRTSYKDLNTENSWENRKKFYLKTIQLEDEAKQLMQLMGDRLSLSLKQHLPIHSTPTSFKKQIGCLTCFYSDKEPFPLCETKYFRLALKTSFDKEGVLYGNFPYPYRILIALKRHDFMPSKEEWKELRSILDNLQTKVTKDIGAEYASYSYLQDLYFRNKNDKNNQKEDIRVPDTPHFFLHFIFRFPHGIKINDIYFDDPNPYHQFKLCQSHMVKENHLKPNSNFIYKRTPDIINIQELTFDQLQFLMQELSNHHFIGYSAFEGLPLDKIKKDTFIQEILAIAYRPDRCECLDHGLRWISSTPSEPSIGFGSSRERIIIWGKFKDTVTGNIFFIFNAHYDHLGGRQEYIDVESKVIQEIAKDNSWFAFGERFYKNYNGEALYRYYLESLNCSDVRDISLLGHYGEAGSWGGFAEDPCAVSVKQGAFNCDTLDVGFTNAKKIEVILSYSISGAYDKKTNKLYSIEEPIMDGFQLASDHFMTGIYIIFRNSLEN